MSKTIPLRYPMAILMDLIITLLTPMFLAAAGNNLTLAQQAAAETLNAYRAESQADMITVAKIVAFGLAALTTLTLSMAEDLPLKTILRLHASANASDRSEHRNRQTLQQNQARRPKPAPRPEPVIDQAALTAAAEAMKARTAENLAQLTTPAAKPVPAPTPAPAPQPAPTITAPSTITDPPTITDRERRYQATWAASAAAVAAETAAALPTLPPEERASAALWIEVLNDCANDFMAGNPLPRPQPGDLAGMMRPSPPTG